MHAMIGCICVLPLPDPVDAAEEAPRLSSNEAGRASIRLQRIPVPTGRAASEDGAQEVVEAEGHAARVSRLECGDGRWERVD